MVGFVLIHVIMMTTVVVMIVMMMMIPIEVVLLLNVIKHGDDVHRLQQPLPSILVQVTDGHEVVVGRALTPNDLVTLESQFIKHVIGQP